MVISMIQRGQYLKPPKLVPLSPPSAAAMFWTKMSEPPGLGAPRELSSAAQPKVTNDT